MAQSSIVDHHDTSVKADPNMSIECQQALREKVGLDMPEVAALFGESEFFSLGSWCGVALTLEKMGLRKAALPFDYVRVSLDGVLQCLQSDFDDFASFSEIHVAEGGHKFFYGSSWGGSFYHHDIEQEHVRQMFSRRIERFLGGSEGKIPASRVFIRVANSPQEVEESLSLMAALEQKFQDAPVYLLVIVDMQKTPRLLRLQNTNANILFYHAHEDLWMNCGKDLLTQRHRCADTYADGIGAALRYWSEGLRSRVQAARVPDVKVLRALTENFDGGNAARELYRPQRLKDPFYLRVPEKWTPSITHIKASHLGKEYSFPVPRDCKAGLLLELRLEKNSISAKIAGSHMQARHGGA
jgi:hypothetical protein